MAHKRRATAASHNRTFWNKLRMERNLSLEEIAAATNYSDGTVGNYFSGLTMASEDFIQKACAIFGIGLVEGRAKFEEAYNNNPRRKEEAAAAGKAATGDETEAMSRLRAFYGELDFGLYLKLTEAVLAGEDPLTYLYGKVDFDTYMKAAQLWKEA